MKEKLKQMGYKMQQSMIGRYGIDALYKALLVIYLILVVTGSALAGCPARSIPYCGCSPWRC